MARYATSSRTPGSVADVVKQALEDALRTRYPAPYVEEPHQSAKTKRRKAKPSSDATASEADEEAPGDQLH